MEVGFSDSQLELRAAVREVLAKECPPSVGREALADPDRWRPLWKTAVDLGWPALAMLDDDAGMGVVELVAVLEEVGAAVAPLPLLSSAGLAGGALRAAGDSAAPWLEELAGGAVGSLAAGGGGTRRLAPAVRYDGSRLTGQAGAVPDATIAELLVVLATAGDGSTIAAVVRPGAGVELTPATAVDPARPAADVRLDVAAEAVLPVAFEEAMAVPLTAAAAEMVGLAARALDVSVVHATTREQFGKPIGTFQGVKHRLADCYVAIERARSLTYAAAMQLTDPEASAGERWRSALLAKAAAGEAAVDAARAGVQVHGALGMTWEHDMHLYLRRAWQSSVVLGDSRLLYREAARAWI